MKPREILFGSEAQERITEGLQETANAVKSTLGPKGKNVLIQTANGYQFTKDGITVAKNVEFLDNFKNMGAQIAREAGNRSVKAAGDGPQPLYAKVLTPSGWVEMGQLKVGDTVCGTNGTKQTVLGIFPKGKRKIVELHFSDKRVVECCDDHLWTVTSAINGKERTMTVRDLKKTRIVRPDNNQRMWFVKNDSPEMEEKNLKLDPYLVGLLLGDGTLTGTGSIEMSIGYAKKHCLDKIILPSGLYLKTTKVEDKNSYRVKIQGTTEDGKTIKELVDGLGLLGVSSLEKFIPSEYLFASKAQRTALYQGLIDTDGHKNVRGRSEFSSFSKRLAGDFLMLCRSLAIPVWHGTVERTGYSSNPSHRINELKGAKYGTALSKIVSTDKETEMMCIKVSNDDHLYFTDNFILTHNTTSTITLLNGMVQGGKRQIGLGTDPMSLRRGLDAAAAEAVRFVKKMSTPVTSSEDLRRVATISANGDTEIGQIIASTLDKVGADATVTLEEGHGESTKVEMTKGFEFDRGMVTEHFMRDFEKQRVVYSEAIYDANHGNDDPRFLPPVEGEEGDPRAAYVWLVNGRLGSLQNNLDIVSNILGAIHQTNVPLIIIAEAIEGDCLKLLASNAVRGQLNVVPVRAPGFGADRKDLLDDLAAFTGAKLRRPDMGETLFDKFELSELGTVRYAQVGIEKTVLIPCDSQSAAIEARVAEIEAKIAVTTDDDFKHKLVRRKSMISGGVASIIVGGRSDAEIREKRDLYEDALLAARAAAQAGVVAGAGTMLVRASQHLANFKTGNEHQDVGVHVLRNALLVPFQEIIKNGGGSSEVVLDKILNSDSLSFGYDSSKNEYCDMLERGIIDPTKVVVSEIEHASSMAGLLLSTDAVIGFSEEPDLVRAFGNMAGQKK